ncbi:MAG: hypothetical protein WC073_04855 [Sterolibacterium sp.]
MTAAPDSALIPTSESINWPTCDGKSDKLSMDGFLVALHNAKSTTKYGSPNFLVKLQSRRHNMKRFLRGNGGPGWITM